MRRNEKKTRNKSRAFVISVEDGLNSPCHQAATSQLNARRRKRFDRVFSAWLISMPKIGLPRAEWECTVRCEPSGEAI
jgi:hypothetical protein